MNESDMMFFGMKFRREYGSIKFIENDDSSNVGSEESK